MKTFTSKEKWLLFYQTQNDMICYQTFVMPEPQYIMYKEFLNIMYGLPILNVQEMRTFLDRFNLIFVDLENNIWNRIDSYDKSQQNTFKDLVEFNKEKENNSISKNNPTVQMKTVDKLSTSFTNKIRGFSNVKNIFRR